MRLYAVIIDRKFCMLEATDCIDVYRQIAKKQKFLCIECKPVATVSEGKAWYKRMKKMKLVYKDPEKPSFFSKIFKR